MANNKDIFGFLGGDIKTKIFTLIVIILLVVLLVWGGSKLISWIKSLLLSERSELNSALLSGEKLSYSESQYKSFADKLYVAMKGLSTDTTAIYSVFNAMNNKADVLKLVTAFGVRDGETLTAWLGGEWRLSVAKLNEILMLKGIDYQF